MTILIKSATVSTATGLEKFRRDAILKGDSGGVRYLFDLPSPAGWPGQTGPVDGNTIPNLATTTGLMTLGDGDFDIIAGQSAAFAGGGFSFSGLTAEPANVQGPANALASIAAAANDYFLVVAYLKFPASGDWNTNAVLAPFFCTTDGVSGYATPEADLLTIGMANTPGVSARRQTDGGTTVVGTAITANMSKFYGQVVQVGYWRNAAGVGLRMKSTVGEETTTGAVGSNNSGDFSAKRPKWGVPESFNNLASLTTHRNTHKTRLYRGWIEDLTISGRTPTTVLDADWTNVQARIAASAAANGGTSLIFV